MLSQVSQCFKIHSFLYKANIDEIVSWPSRGNTGLINFKRLNLDSQASLFMAVSPRPLSPVLLFGLVPVASWFIVRPFLEPAPSIPALYSSFGFSIFAFLATIHLVPALGPTFIKANLKGRDLLKTYQTPMSVYRFYVINGNSLITS